MFPPVLIGLCIYIAECTRSIYIFIFIHSITITTAAPSSIADVRVDNVSISSANISVSSVPARDVCGQQKYAALVVINLDHQKLKQPEHSIEDITPRLVQDVIEKGIIKTSFSRSYLSKISIRSYVLKSNEFLGARDHENL